MFCFMSSRHFHHTVARRIMCARGPTREETAEVALANVVLMFGLTETLYFDLFSQSTEGLNMCDGCFK